MVGGRMMQRVFDNRTVHSVVIVKNQGGESVESQRHLHQQLIGSPAPLPALEAEARAERENPGFWNELIDIVDRLELLLEKNDGVVSYANPIGPFPRSYDIVMPDFCGVVTDLSPNDLRPFARALFRIIRIPGPQPLDYEVPQCAGLRVPGAL